MADSAYENPLLDLPNEILLEIIRQLNSWRDACNLASTCKEAWMRFNQAIYEKEAYDYKNAARVINLGNPPLLSVLIVRRAPIEVIEKAVRASKLVMGPESLNRDVLSVHPPRWQGAVDVARELGSTQVVDLLMKESSAQLIKA